jgi:hypothetical protein
MKSKTIKKLLYIIAVILTLALGLFLFRLGWG